MKVGKSRVIRGQNSPFGIPLHVALPVDLSTGEFARTRMQAQEDRFEFITPDRIVETVRASMGFPAKKESVLKNLLRS